MGEHDGHRSRVRDRYAQSGLDNFTECDVLELILFYAIPRRDTKDLAEALLKHFGSLSAVFAASRRQLMDVPGIGENTAMLLELIPGISRKIATTGLCGRPQILNSVDAGNYLLPYFAYAQDEIVLLITLDTLKRVISCQEISHGSTDSAEINTRAVVEISLRNKASSIILAHNHPGGVALPSREDFDCTRRLVEALELVGIKLVDHIIIAGDDFVSLADTGAFNFPR